MSTKTVKNIREPLKKPRPLKIANLEQARDSVGVKTRSDLLTELEMLNVRISNCDFDEAALADISHMCLLLKKHGDELDAVHKDALDRYFSNLRNVCRNDRLDVVSRLKLLEIIEMRALHWKVNENDSNYFNTRYNQLEEANERQNMSGSVSPSIQSLNVQNQNLTNNASLLPGELLKSSGKFSKPTKIAGKNYFKDEIVIRNCDSGKVNAGARDRLVQITGPHEEAISHAKYLVEDTIKRNVSPVRDNTSVSEVENGKEVVDFGHSYFDRGSSGKRALSHSYSMSDATTHHSRDFCLPLQVGKDIIVLSGANANLLKTAQAVLMEYFSGPLESPLEQDSNNLSQAKTNSNQRFLLKREVSLQDNVPSVSLSRQSSSMSSSDDDVLPEEETSDPEPLIISPPVPAPIPPPSYPPGCHQVYSREFLLECAHLPLSRKQPPDYDTYTRNFPELRPHSPSMFDPSPYLSCDNF